MDPYKVRNMLNIFIIRYWFGFCGEVEVPRGMGMAAERMMNRNTMRTGDKGTGARVKRKRGSLYLHFESVLITFL